MNNNYKINYNKNNLIKMRRRFQNKKEADERKPEEEEVQEQPPKEETYAERRRKRLAERKKQKQREKEEESKKEEEKKTEEAEVPKYTRRYRRAKQEEKKEEEHNSDNEENSKIKQKEEKNEKKYEKRIKSSRYRSRDDDQEEKEKEIQRKKEEEELKEKEKEKEREREKEKKREKENEKKIQEMKNQYDKIKINSKIEENEEKIKNKLSKEKPKEEPEEEEEEEINIDVSGKAFNEKLEELSKLAKTTQLDYFFEGTYCDIKDQYTNQWKTGLVLERTDEEVKIKYYYSNINKTVFTFKVVDAIDKDIAMFRKNTQEENYYYNNAYQKMRDTAVTNPMLFEAKAALKVLCSMKHFSNKEFDEAFESPLEIVQELRGKLYYIFLNIINNNFQFEYVEEQKAIARRKNPKRAAKEEEEDQEKFDIENDISVNDIGDLINDYLDFSVKYLQWINSHPEIGRLLTFNYNFMLFDKECAFFSSLYEFSSILSMLFRENKFFMTYRDQITECLKDWGLEKVDFKISTTLYNLTKNKGIDKILKGILVNENQSLFVFEQIAKILASNGFVLFEDRSKIYDFYFNRVNNLTMNEQKFISFDDIENYCEKIRTLIDAVTIDNKEERNADTIHLHFVYKLINTDNLPLKIRGIALFSKLIREEEIAHKHITHFIQQVHLVSKVILGPNIHEEILKRSKEIFIYVLKDKEANNTKMVKTLHEELNNKNKSIAEEVKKILTTITAYFNQDLQDYYFNQILNKIKIEDYTVESVEVLKSFTFNTRNMDGLDLLWKIINQNNKSEVVDEAIYSISDIFEKKLMNLDVAIKYLKLCFDKIEKEDNIQCMKLFKNFMEIYGDEIRNEIIEINNQKDILQILLKNFDNYIKLKKEQKNSLLYKIADNIEIRLRVIFFIYDQLNNNVFDKGFEPVLLSLWKSAILCPYSSDIEKNVFCSYLYNRSDVIENNKEIRNYLFYKIMLDEIKNPPHNIIYNEICLFNKLIYTINRDKFVWLGSIQRVGDPNDIDGFDFLWKILKVNDIEKVRRSVCSMLVYMCINPTSIKNAKRCEEVWNNYYQRIFNMIKKHRDNDVVTINNIVFLLQTFVDYLNRDSTFIIEQLPRFNKNNCISIPFYNGNQNVTRQIPIDLEKDKVYMIKERVSHYFQLPFKLVELKFRNELMPIQYEDDDKYFNSFINMDMNTNIEIDVFEGPYKIYTLFKNPKKILLEDENISGELFYYLGQYNKYNKADDMDYYAINKLIYSYPVGKKMLDDIHTFKIWEKLKNDTSIYSKNYLIKIIKSKIADKNWLELLKKENKMERLFFNILSTYEITMEGKNKEHLNEIEFMCLENLLYITDKTEDVKGSSSYENMYHKCIELLYKVISNDKVENGLTLDALFSFMSNNKNEKTSTIIIRNKNDYIRKIVTDCLLRTSGINNKNKQKVIDFFESNDIGDEAFLGIFNYMLDTDLLKKLISSNDNKTDDDSFFKAVLAFMRKANLDEETLDKQRRYILFNINDIVNLIIKYLNNYNSLSEKEKNIIVITGLLSILKEIMFQNEGILLKLKNDNKFFVLIFEKCLFKENMCVSNRKLLKILFEILTLLIINNKSNTERVLKELVKNYDMSFWRTPQKPEWFLTPSRSKNHLGKVGLVNLGHTCYFNSLIQQLYMNKFIRENIIGDEDKKNNSNNVFKQLKTLLTQMKFTFSDYINPNNMINSIENWDKRKLNPNEQMDVTEFFNLLCERCSCPEIQECFEGKFYSTFTCDECNHDSSSTETFTTINLQVKNHKNLKESLNSFFEGEIFDGENMYFCEKCKKKVRAEKKISIKDLPKSFVFVLNRFEFDYDKMIRNKINNYCELPQKIDMTSFYDGVEVDSDLTFDLTGMIIHEGNSEFGHYYSIIKDEELNKWILFNDNQIMECEEEFIENHAFGNKEENGPVDTPSAYVIFYKRGGSDRNVRETVKNIKDIKDQATYEYISYENDKSKISQIYFTNEFKSFMQDFVINYNLDNIKNIYSQPFITKNNNWERYPLKREMSDIINSNIDYLLSKYNFIERKLKKTKVYTDDFEIFKLYAKYFLYISIRLKDNSYIEEGIDLFKSLLNNSIDNCLWLINNFSNINVLEEFLITNPVIENKHIITGILYCALIQLNKNSSEDNDYQKIIQNFINIIIYLISHKQENYPYYDLSLLYSILVKFVSFGDKSFEYLESLKIIEIIKVFFYHKHTDGEESEETLKNYYVPEIRFKEFSKNNELILPNELLHKKNNEIIRQPRENCSAFIILLCKIILWKKSYMSVFKADDYAFCSSLFLESNDRVCIAHLIHIFKKNSDDIEIKNVVNHSIIPLLLNIIQISEDNQINYIIYFFDYLCSFVDPGVNNNNLFIIIKKYFQIIKDNYKYYLYTFFNIKNVIYLFKKYFPNSSDLIGQLEIDFRSFIKWLNDNPYSPAYYPGNTSLYKTYSYDYGKIKISTMQYEMFKLEFKKKTNEIKENLVKILSGKFKDVIEDPELEIYTDGNDYTNYKFSVGDILKANLKEGVVAKVLDEMIFMKFTEGKKITQKWIWTDTSLKIIKMHKKEDEEVNEEQKINE